MGANLRKRAKDLARKGRCCDVGVGRSSRTSPTAIIRTINRRTAGPSCEGKQSKIDRLAGRLRCYLIAESPFRLRFARKLTALPPFPYHRQNSANGPPTRGTLSLTEVFRQLIEESCVHSFEYTSGRVIFGFRRGARDFRERHRRLRSGGLRATSRYCGCLRALQLPSPRRFGP